MSYFKTAGYACIPAAYLVHYWLGVGWHWEPIATFFLAGLGVVPLATLMGEATEQLSERAGPTWGGLLNASFGNAAELIIAIMAVYSGINDVVKATLTGSIVCNLLLVAGFAMVVGGWRCKEQRFNAFAAETNAGMLALAVAAMLIPAIFHYTAERMHDPQEAQHEHAVSFGASAVLLITYALGLLFTLKTHRHIYGQAAEVDNADAANSEKRQVKGEEQWSLAKSLLALVGSAVVVAFLAELLVGSAESLATDLGWSHLFIGVILLAIIGNAAEHSTAVMMAYRNNMDTAMTIVYQSGLQIALFVVPVVVFVSAAMAELGWGKAAYLDLVFSPLEVAAVLLAVGIVVVLSLNGKSNWFEGVLLLALYAILGTAFFYVPSHPGNLVAPASQVSNATSAGVG